jgi:cysteine desulfurase/selenocysteine lyase
LSERATALYEGARKKAATFLNAADAHTIVLTKGTTDGINLVAQSYGRSVLKAGDEILLSWLEHHSNIVPWQLVAEQTGAVIKVVSINELGEIDQDEYARLLSPRTKIVAVGHVSNALGTINPIKSMIAQAHAAGAVVLVDGAQAAPHLAIDVQDLDCDFYVFSGHKMFAPTGSGVVYGKLEILETMNPFQGGGDMIRTVTFEKTTFADLPNKFEAGTPAIASQIGLGAAIDYLSAIGRSRAVAYEHELLRYATEKISAIEGVRIIGTAAEKASVVSFVVDDVHPHDIGTILDQEGIAVRAGHHCAQPVMKRFNVPATARASFAFYNTKQEVDTLVRAIEKVIEVFS